MERKDSSTELAGVPESGKPCCMCLAPYCSRWISPTAAEARLISWISIVSTVCLVAIGLTIQEFTKSTSALATAIDGFADILTSASIIWRFWKDNESESEARASESREVRAEVIIGFSLIILAVSVIATAAESIKEKNEVANENLVLVLSVPSFIIYTALGTTKIFMAKKMKSSALRHDGISCIFGGLLSASVILEIILENFFPDCWFLDETFALIISAFISALGIYILASHRWYTLSFWSKGDGYSYEYENAQKDLSVQDLSPVKTLDVV
mmetsp:Transcript_8943/g.10709  ORF Transcript_8943/g.10709 Transcript_8943/m.10709 type:complete len:271 (+) Transcript_8943:411-1223(+)